MHNVLTNLITRNRWFNARPVRTGLMVPVPPLKGDPWRCSTVLPYLEAYHYQHDRDTQAVYFTEHDMNRKIISVLCKPCCAVLLNHLVRLNLQKNWPSMPPKWPPKSDPPATALPAIKTLCTNQTHPRPVIMPARRTATTVRRPAAIRKIRRPPPRFASEPASPCRVFPLVN